MKISIICFWPGYDKNACPFRNYFFKDMEYSDDYENSDVVLIGSFIYDYSIFKKIKGKKIAYISEPILNSIIPYINDNILDMTFGCVSNDIEKNKFKYSLGFMYRHYLGSNKVKELDEINQYVKHAVLPENFCCLISRHDPNGLRTAMYNMLKNFGNISCPSNLLNNCSNDELNTIGKQEYLKKFKFHICPENTLGLPGYITEKILECCVGGAIPIYAGNFDHIDEKIYNVDRILFFDYSENSMQRVVNIIINLLHNPEEFENFYRQPVFMDSAIDTISGLEKVLTDKVKVC
jgi:hypothetical protein